MLKASDQVTRAITSHFDRRIERTLSTISATVASLRFLGAEPEAFERVLHGLLRRHGWQQAHRLFVYEFHRYRRSKGFSLDPQSSRAFDAFCEELDHERVADWFDRYEVWRQMTIASVNNTLSFVEGVARDFVSDSAALIRAGLVTPDAVLVEIEALDSDPHNGSKVVLSFGFDTGERVIYKPRSLAPDVLVRRLFEDIVQFPEFDGRPPVPSTFDCGDHGWQEFVIPQRVGEDEVACAYRNFGLCSAVLTAIGSTDIHDENVIFDGVHPLFIDLETGLRAGWQRFDATLADSLAEVVSRSVCSTSIIPAKLPTTPKSLLIGAINTPLPQVTSEKLFAFKNPGTDALDIARSVQEITRDQVPLRLNTGQAADPIPYQDAFVEGYRQGYRRVMGVREKLIACLSDSEFPVRKILRPTAHYSHFLSAALFAENLADESAMCKLFSYMSPPAHVLPEEGAAILEQEKASLLAGDIPFASSRANDTTLQVGSFETSAVFAVSPVENAIETLRSMDEASLLQDERIIAEGFSYIRAHCAETRESYETSGLAPMFEEVIQRMAPSDPSPLMALLVRLAVRSRGESPEIGWLNGTYGDSPISYHSSGLVSLHDSGGLLLPFEHAAEEPERWEEHVPRGFADGVRAGLRSLRQAYDSGLRTAPPSIISGIPSIEFLLGHAGSRLLEVEGCALECMTHEHIDDLFGGELGLAVALATFPGTSEELLDRMYGRVKRVLSHRELPLGGLAHGELGAVWAQTRLAVRLGDTSGCELAARAAMTMEFSDGWEGSGWCNGRAGVLMVAADLGAEYQPLLSARRIAESMLGMPVGPIDLAVCHGAGGTLQSLLYAGASLGDSWFFDVAEDYWSRCLDHARAHRCYVGEPYKDHLMGYMLGWGGVADSGLLLTSYKYGREAWIPISLSRSTKEKK